MELGHELKNAPALSYRKNRYGQDRWMLTNYLRKSDFGDASLTLEINHHYAYKSVADYRCEAYKLILDTEEGYSYEIVTKKEFEERRNIVEEHEGYEAAEKWRFDNSLIIDNYLAAIGDALKLVWETMVFNLKLFYPTVCLS